MTMKKPRTRRHIAAPRTQRHIAAPRRHIAAPCTRKQHTRRHSAAPRTRKPRTCRQIAAACTRRHIAAPCTRKQRTHRHIAAHRSVSSSSNYVSQNKQCTCNFVMCECTLRNESRTLIIAIYASHVFFTLMSKSRYRKKPALFSIARVAASPGDSTTKVQTFVCV